MSGSCVADVQHRAGIASLQSTDSCLLALQQTALFSCPKLLTGKVIVEEVLKRI